MGGIPAWATDLDGKLSAIQKNIDRFIKANDEKKIEARKMAIQDIKFECKKIIKYCTRQPMDSEDLEYMAQLYCSLKNKHLSILNEITENFGLSTKNKVQSDLKSTESFYAPMDQEFLNWGDLQSNHLEIENYIKNYRITSVEYPSHFKSWEAYQVFLKYFDDFIGNKKIDGQYKEHSFIFNELKQLDLIDHWTAKKWVEWLKHKGYITPEAYNFFHTDKAPMVMAPNKKYRTQRQTENFEKLLEKHGLD